MAVATIARSGTVSGFQPDDRYKSCSEARTAGWVFSQGGYSTKRDQFRASHISGAQGIGAHKPHCGCQRVGLSQVICSRVPATADCYDHGNATTDRRCIAALGGEKGASGSGDARQTRQCRPQEGKGCEDRAARALGATVGSTRLAKRRYLREALTVTSSANQRLGLLSGHHPIIVLGVLVEILCFDRIATQECGLCERQITLVLSFCAGHVVVAVSASLSGPSGRTKT
jgi:hypothetical protein